MGYSKYFQSNSKRSSVTNYKDYSRLPVAATPDRPALTTFRTWADTSGLLNFHDGYTNIIGKFLTGVQTAFDSLVAAIKIVGSMTFDTYSVIIGGNGGTIPNTATGTNNLVTGCANAAPGSRNLVAGSGNSAISNQNVLTGMNNIINSVTFGDCNSVSGRDNSVTGEKNIISGSNQVIEGSHNVISGKNIHLSGSTSSYNAISGLDQVVAAAANNIISGRDHDITGINNAIAGSAHHIDGDYNGAEGYGHRIYGDFNHAEGHSHSLPDRKDHCHAEGREAACYNYSQHAEAAGKFAGGTAGNAQYTTVVAKGITTDLTPVKLQVDLHDLYLAHNKGYSFTVRVFGIISTLDHGYSKEIRGVISIGPTDASTILLVPVVDTIILDMGDGFTAVVSVDTTYGTLKIMVTGSATEAVRWIAYVEMLELSFL